MTRNKMKVAIWSDVSCPFCYMGKRHFETALSQFKDRQNIELDWKSFELAPGIKTQPDKNMNQVLAELKGISLEQATAMGDQVATMAAQLGLEFNFHTAVPANSFKAHRLVHLASEHALQDQMKERLFKAYFTEGKNIDDIPTLVSLGVEIGLAAEVVTRFLESERFTEEVDQDIQEARQLGITGVPAFVFNGSKKVMGAQGSATFLEVLETSFREWQGSNSGSAQTETDGMTCTVGESC